MTELAVNAGCNRVTTMATWMGFCAKQVIAEKHFTSARATTPRAIVECLMGASCAPVGAARSWLAVLPSVFVGLLMGVGLIVAPLARAQAQAQSPPEFAKLVGQLAPSDGADESPQSKAAEEQALTI